MRYLSLDIHTSSERKVFDELAVIVELLKLFTDN